MELMAKYPDNHFELAIVDPPYGISINHNIGRRKGEKSSGNKKFTWDNSIPSEDYFIELQRVSKNQIIWGGNYFTNFLYNSRCWIYWRKLMGGSFSDGELAWTSFDSVVKEYTFCPKAGKSIHPTQKPIKLYEWLLANYAKEGDKILDTHLGSASSRIACHNLKFDFTGCELDKDYFDQAEARYAEHIKQLTLF
jgi:site-specific DNA-methyltransferase (adenine-specific)